jgi:hypothetical protein
MSTGHGRGGPRQHSVGGMAGRGLSRKQRKEAFLQANFRFVVSDRVDAQRYMEQADQMFEWEDVLQVSSFSASMAQCLCTKQWSLLHWLCSVFIICNHVLKQASIGRIILCNVKTFP